MITQTELKKLIAYNPETGRSVWNEKTGDQRWGKAKSGNEVGCLGPDGYLITSINGISIRVHRLVWFYMTGELPESIDHKNRIKTDNRFRNLRAATRSQNSHNTGMKPNNKSGFKGVRWNKQCGKWQAAVKLKYKQYHAGLFENPRDAAKAYDEKAIELHGDFARTNKMLGLL